MDSKSPEKHEEIIQQIINSMIKSLGIHVVTIIFEHALWKTKHKYEEADLISLNDETVHLDLSDKIDPEKAEFVVHEFLLSIIDSLTCLVGKQMAAKLVRELNNEEGDCVG